MAETNFLYCYKFLAFNPGSLAVLLDGTLKYTCPLEFNDPFDCRPALCEVALAGIEKTKSDVIHAIGKQRGLTPAQRIQAKRRIANEVRRYHRSGQSIESVLAEAGVVSLSTDPSNVLMWSHYADFHRGFVVEFKIPLYGTRADAAKVGQNLIPLEVGYSARRPEVRYGIDTNQELLHKMVFTKSLDWRYEKEHRVLDLVRGPGIHSYSRNKLLFSVVAGMRMPEEHLKKLESIISGLRSEEGLSHLRVYRAKADEKKYKVVIPGHPYWAGLNKPLKKIR